MIILEHFNEHSCSQASNRVTRGPIRAELTHCTVAEVNAVISLNPHLPHTNMADSAVALLKAWLAE